MTERETIETVGLVLAALHETPSLEPVFVSPPGPHEVRIRMVAAGLCHTDIGYMNYARQCPVLLGHEGSGYVESVGSDVSSLEIGDRVVVNWRPACGRCLACVRGRRHQCESPRGTGREMVRWRGEPLAVMLNAGTFCEYAVVPEAGAVRIPHSIPFAAGAVLGCAVATGLGAALITVSVEEGSSVVVLGVGGVGLNVVQGARLAGAAPLVAVDLDSHRLRLAAELGASHIVDAGQHDVAKTVLSLTGGRGADFVFDVVGSPRTIGLAIDLLAHGGTAVLIGAADRSAEVTFKPREFMSGQKRIVGCIYGNVSPEVDFARFASWYLDGEIEVDSLVSETVSLFELPQRFSSPDRPAGHVRTVVLFDEPDDMTIQEWRETA